MDAIITFGLPVLPHKAHSRSFLSMLLATEPALAFALPTTCSATAMMGVNEIQEEERRKDQRQQADLWKEGSMILFHVLLL
jgi:hypothetical protein